MHSKQSVDKDSSKKRKLRPDLKQTIILSLFYAIATASALWSAHARELGRGHAIKAANGKTLDVGCEQNA